MIFFTSSCLFDSIDQGKISILAALDMSAAFDTLDHATLLHRPEHTFSLSGCVISWIRSYLSEHSFYVKIDTSCFSPTGGVPQGLVFWTSFIYAIGHLTHSSAVPTIAVSFNFFLKKLVHLQMLCFFYLSVYSMTQYL